MSEQFGYVYVRIDTKRGDDGWCFCTPKNHPKDIEAGLKPEWADNWQFFACVDLDPRDATIAELRSELEALISDTGRQLSVIAEYDAENDRLRGLLEESALSMELMTNLLNGPMAAAYLPKDEYAAGRDLYTRITAELAKGG